MHVSMRVHVACDGVCAAMPRRRCPQLVDRPARHRPRWQGGGELAYSTDCM
jgi:hypothetical protein